MNCNHSYEIRTLEAIYIEPAEQWVFLTGPFYRNEKNERCIAHNDTFYSIEGAVEKKTFVACHICGEEFS